VSRKYKVLLAEDELSVNHLLQRYLRMIGLDVVAATNGHEALDLFRREAPDLLVSDVDMPGMSGLQLLSSIRETDRLLPAILVSGRGDPEAGRKQRDYRFMPKPIVLAELWQEIQLAIAS
jgi:CheY-like chemotaxis protein